VGSTVEAEGLWCRVGVVVKARLATKDVRDVEGIVAF
jgi:hypothetical protein